jgi:hypothetical protein
MDRDSHMIELPDDDDDEYDPLEIARALVVRSDAERRRDALERSAPPPVPMLPRTLPLRRRAVRQINFRVSPSEYDEIHTVAGLYGVSPSRIARMLTLRGVRRVASDA